MKLGFEEIETKIVHAVIYPKRKIKCQVTFDKIVNPGILKSKS